MTPERWQQVENIAQAALDLAPGADREQLVDERCAGDDELRAAVDRLLAADEEAGDFIEEPVWAGGAPVDTMLHADIERALAGQLPAAAPAVAEDLTGKRFGAFEIKKELGRGGMGAVYLAERVSGGFRQKAAVKLIRRGVDTDFVVARFRRERQILAALEHPFIARLFDGGTTGDGLPFFVMEYVEGEPLDAYCARRNLCLSDRISLFRSILEAVGAAHQAGVVHRDLKPSNILVKADGTPKLLDFGIAKILDRDLTGETLEPTATQMRLMTPEYASPEQIRGESVTPASDIYSLGVLLYELLTGHRPYRLKNRSPEEIRRVVCEQEPPPPSAALAREEQRRPPASGEKTDDSKMRLGGALDAIVLKALRKNPEQRYRSIDEFAADLERSLERLTAEEEFSVEAGARASAGGKTAVAILPFRFFAAEQKAAGDDFLGIGLADSLITRLSGVARLVVRPTGSVLPFGDAADPLAAGQALSVDWILSGRIRRAGGRIRVSAQLLNVAENATRWAETFDVHSTNVLELEDSISERVARALLERLTGVETELIRKRSTESPEAFELYLRGRYHWNQMTAEGFSESIEFYRRAAAVDESFAAAHAGIAEYYSWMAVYGLLPPTRALAQAREAAARAVALDASSAEAHAAHGLALLAHETQWQLAGGRFRRAIELNQSSATAHVLDACQLAMEGRFAESAAQARRARALDPLNPFNIYIAAWCFYQARDFARSIEENERLIGEFPHYGSGYFTLSWALRRAGRLDEAVRAAEKAVALAGPIPMISAALAAACAEAGDEKRARDILRELDEAAARRFVTPLHRALAHLHLGETETAWMLLEKAVDEKDPWTVWLGTEPQYDTLRADEERFRHLLARAANPFARRARL